VNSSWGSDLRFSQGETPKANALLARAIARRAEAEAIARDKREEKLSLAPLSLSKTIGYPTQNKAIRKFIYIT
jgi:hypothetical protein